MSTLTTTMTRRMNRTGIVIATTALAVLANLALYGIGSLAGATYNFTSASEPAHVDPFTLVGFTAIPLLLGLTTAAVLSRWWRWAIPAGLVVAPAAAILSIPAMPFAVDLDLMSTLALSSAHLCVGAAAVIGLLALRSLPRQPTSQEDTP